MRHCLGKYVCDLARGKVIGGLAIFIARVTHVNPLPIQRYPKLGCAVATRVVFVEKDRDASP